MRGLSRHLIGLLIAGSVFLGGFALFAFYVARHSAPETEGEREVEHISDSVAIYRNLYGIPHVVGRTDNDVFFGIGYAHAQDRLWQMDFTRRVGRGRLSELFGRRTLEHDMLLRSMRFDTIAGRLYRFISPESRAALEAYTHGVNAFIASHQNDMPFECEALGYIPEAWKPEDCLLVARLMGWEMSIAFWTDAAFSAIADKLGTERALQLIPGYASNDPYYAPCVTDSLVPQKPAKRKPVVADSLFAPVLGDTTALSLQNVPTKKHNNTAQHHGQSHALMEMFGDILRRGTALRTFLNQSGSSIGSNSWAVRPPVDTNLTKPLPKKHQHGAILANDTHLGLAVPPRWYEAHLTSSAGLNVVGFTIAGLPFVLVGRNDSVAWGMTNMMIDDCDFFLERVDSTDTRRYIAPDGTPTLFTMITDTIKVRDSSDAVIDGRYTARSCVISDTHTFRNPALMLNDNSFAAKKAATAFFAQHVLTFSWTGHEMSDDILAFYRVNKAQNWSEFLQAAEQLNVPALNLSYADRAGNIGIATAGRLPVRIVQTLDGAKNIGSFEALGADGNPNLLRLGWQQNQQWQGFLPFSQMPNVLNPTAGRVISANNKTARTLPTFFSSLWEPSARAARIGERLSDVEHYSVFEMQVLQTDLVSHYAQDMSAIIVQTLQQSTSATISSKMPAASRTASGVEQQALALLAGWDGALEATSASAAVYTVFLERFVRNTLADELGETLFRQYGFIANVPVRKIAELARMPFQDSVAAWWFDDKTTPNVVETRSDIIAKSFRQAVKFLRDTLHTDSVAAWKYGTIHTLTVPHVMGSEPAIQRVVNIGAYSIGGDITTINNSEWKFEKPFEPKIGASMRFVCDMQDSVVHLILPGGNSGEILTRNYADQMQLWLNGGLLRVSAKRQPAPSYNKRLVLVPKRAL